MYRNAVRDFVYKAWNLPDTLNEYWFPGPQPISIERRHFSLLKKSDYLVAEKTDGIRHLLVSFETKEGEKCVALVNRAFEVTCLQKYTLAKDTILDGELVIRNDDRQIFLVHDAVMIRGESLLQRSLTERLDKARSLAKTILSKSPFTTLVKQMVPLSAMDTLEQGMYKTDGLVFTPVSEPIQTGTHETMFKWKPREHITIDFQIAGGTKLYIQERGRLIQEAELHLTKEFYPDGTIVECGYGDVGWYVVKVRTDKTYPNNRRTFMRTIVNLREDIKREEFLFEEYGTSERT